MRTVNRVKTVLILTSSFPRYDGDYFGPWILDYARELANQNTKVIVIAPNVQNHPHTITPHKNLSIEKFNYWWPFKYQKLVHPPGMIPQIKKNPFRIIQIPFLLIGYFNLSRKIIKSAQVDLIHCQWLIPSGFIGAVIKLIYKIPLFITSQGAELFLPKYHPHSFFTRWTITNTNKIFPVSNQMAERLISFGCAKKNYTVVPNAINTDRFKPSKTSTFRSVHNIPKDAVVILTVRRLVKEKRVEDVISAFERLDTERNIHLVIAGDGPERVKLENLVKEYNIESNVLFLGNIDNKDLPNIYSASNIYIISSQQEGLSLTLLEAMSSECLTISTRTTGAQDVIKEGQNGYLYNVGKIEELTFILNGIIGKNSKEYNSIVGKGRKHIINNFSVKTMVRKWLDEYNETIDE